MISRNKALVIAHRGASGYLPEHTLEAKALAYGMGADYLEQDVVASRNGELIVLHDIHIDRVTNVKDVFPDRYREDGRFYARDFDLPELKSLRVVERLGADGTERVFPGRFPSGGGDFRIATLREEIEMIQGLNRSTGRRVGIYPEVKKPAWHRTDGIDLSPLLLEVLDDHGYHGKDDPVFVQCFDLEETERIRHELGCSLNLIQLIGENAWGESGTDYDALKTPQGIARLAEHVDGVGPSIPQLYTLADIDGQPVSTGLVAAAHEAGLAVHPYTFRADQMAPGFDSFGEMVDWFAGTLGVEGLFTDFPDLVRRALDT